MKTIFSISILLFFLFACSEDSTLLSPVEANIYRTIAYSNLDEGSKQTITGDWQSTPVNSGRYHSDKNLHRIIIDSKTSIPFLLKDKQTALIENQELVAVRFNTINDPLLGPIITIIDKSTKVVIGWVGRL